MKTKGWKSIFGFTFLQQIKTKSFIISTAIIATIIALIAATVNILPAVLLEDELTKIEDTLEGDTEAFTIDKLYIADESGLNANFGVTTISFGITPESIDPSAVEAKIEELADTTENAMLAHITMNDGYLAVDAYYSGINSTISSNDCSSVLTMLANQLDMQYLASIGMNAEQMSTVMAGVSTSLLQAGDEPVSIVDELVNMLVPMIASLILFIFIFSYSQMVAQSIAIEKSSRIMEYLLTSVSPLSIIIGKVLAMCSVSLMQFLIFVAAGGLGFVVSMPFGIFAKIDDIVSAVSETGVGMEAQSVVNDIMSAFSAVNLGTLVIIIITFILGFLVYALIAGLAGASISKMEDLAAAIQPMSIIGVLGFYLAYMPQIGNMEGESNIISVIARYIPISSPFCLPSAYMLGQMTLAEVIIALAILLVCVIILALIVAKVYEHIILHTGDRLKLKDMLKMSESAKKTEQK